MINGKQREYTETVKKIGIAAFKLVGISPDLEGIKAIYPNSTNDKEPNYLMDKSDDKGDYTLSNIVLYLADAETGVINKTNILLSSRERISKDGKYQYINTIGNTVWAKNKEELEALATTSNPKTGFRTYVQNFLKRDYRIALNGEEAIYEFILKLTSLDTRDPEAELIYSTKKLLGGNFSELQKDLLSPNFKDNTVVSTYEIISKKIVAHQEESTDSTTGEVTTTMIPESWKHYQGIYNKFLFGSYLNAFNPGKTTYPKQVQEWIDQLTGANGSKNFSAPKVNGKYQITLARDYIEAENPLNEPTTLHTENEVAGNTSSSDMPDDLPF